MFLGDGNEVKLVLEVRFERIRPENGVTNRLTRSGLPNKAGKIERRNKTASAEESHYPARWVPDQRDSAVSSISALDDAGSSDAPTSI